ncbi:maleate cis-trans isomerase family protein [Emcibacter nanhaiensis]|uniref:Maleate isomerase n=1 Tax=Emcibacter nanhaiensis TaxID=1505037 RepID=A0A501PJ67_9PROT|nr:Asp/Glu racemase [Emcibacter nanhaiensis]TPD60177.1 Asp/Glu racemase [Emcibacter nanhaiensis]
MTQKLIRIGQIVPSSNTTMETEIPAIFRARESIEPERFSFHSSRMRMLKVTKEELEEMDNQSLRCAAELADARMDVMGYACLVAIMSRGNGYHNTAEKNLIAASRENNCDASIVTSAGALCEALHDLGARKVALIAPYMRPLTNLVIEYLAAEGIETLDSISLEIDDNLEVGARDPLALVDIFQDLKTDGADAVVLSACVQMPSLAAVDRVQAMTDLPVVTSSISTAYVMMKRLGLKTVAPGAGKLLSA